MAHAERLIAAALVWADMHPQDEDPAGEALRQAAREYRAQHDGQEWPPKKVAEKRD